MLDAFSRRLFLTLADSTTLQRTVGRYGMRGPRSFARRFIGERDVDEAIAAARSLERRGLLHRFNYLGEHVRSLDAAEQATPAYIRADADLKRVNLLGIRVRLVTGAYKEPADVAYQSKRDVDDAYVLFMARSLLYEQLGDQRAFGQE